MSNDRWEDEKSQEGAGLWQDFRGVPSDPLQTKGELLLSQQRDILDTLRDRMPERESGSSLDIPKVEVMPPQVHTDVHINIPDMAETLKPQLYELIDAEREVAQTTKGVGYVSQMVLQESKVQTGILDEIGQTGRKAVEQRDKSLTKLTQAASSLSRIDRGIKGTNSSLSHIDRGIQQTNQQLEGLNDGMQSLDNGIQGANRLLGDINEGVWTMDQGVKGTNIRMELLNKNLISLLGDIGQGIGGMTNEMVTTRLEILEMLKHMQGVYLWSHREQMWWMKSLYDALTNPISTRTLERWKKGEICRNLGNFRGAVKMFTQNLDEDETDYRTHFSLGLMELGAGRAKESYEYFDRAADYAYAYKDVKMTAFSLMHKAKVHMFEGDFTDALHLFNQATDLDFDNLECWYETAICLCKMGNHQQSGIVLQGLLQRSRKYMMKILLEPSFFPLHPILNTIMAQILHI